MLEQLLEKQLIQLPECKRPEQAGKVDDPNYCKYHPVISHSVEKCFVLKELILRLAREKKIELDLEEFGTFEPVVVQFHQEVAPEDSQEKERSIEEDDEGWTVVTRRKKRKFLCGHQDENPGVVACHAINATEEESIPLRSLEEEGVSKDLSRFNVDDLLSLPQETKTILVNALLNSAASSSSAPTATY
ncbi:retrotransposon gag protein [Cucumis melo var. makuwa]|uniref:Retrotransposon gag protein n=1 Tax=Cucumis melo var. makuwa TaxID=1194695 RepID=A0A5D3D7R9_CUCMM|nr:retrotransposon gag protein [Cucumis melo var. makuwa]TYK19594.1 retrotransposon gag protein [Cucumis melo var. makuwa]